MAQVNPPTSPWLSESLHSDSHRLPESVSMSGWVNSVQSEIGRTLADPAFPCVFAREAWRRGAIQFHFCDSTDDEDELFAVGGALEHYLRFCDSLPPDQSLLETFAVVFKPITPALPLEQYHQQAWRVLQYFHDHDSYDWPTDIPIDPDHPNWSFCFAGTPVFVNVSAPGHRIRRSRNLCRSLVLVMQPRSNFDLVAGINHPNGEAVREQIRQRMADYDQLESPTELGTYGDPANREWHQYVLREANVVPTGRCPLNIRPSRTA